MQFLSVHAVFFVHAVGLCSSCSVLCFMQFLAVHAVSMNGVHAVSDIHFF